jgi:hypothetical protein
LLYGASKKGNLKMKLKWLFPALGVSLGGTWMAGLLLGCASRSAQNPKPVASPVEKLQKASSPAVISQTDNIRVEFLDSPPIPIDLAARPSFSTQGSIIAREKYTNLNDHVIKLIASQLESSLVLQSQIRNWAANEAGGSTSTTLAIVVSVTTPKTAFDIERISNSLLNSAVELPAGAEMILSWRISPAPGLPLCPMHLGPTIFNHTGTLNNAAEGSSVTGTFTRKVDFSDGFNGAQGNLFSGSVPNPSSGTVNTTPNTYGSLGNCVWLDYINSSPETYDTDLVMDNI